MGKVDSSTKRTYYIVERPEVVFPPVRSLTYMSASPAGHCVDPANIPTLDEWRTLWKIWDLVTLKMIPQHMLHQKPIDLRHKCLFYIGHIPTSVRLVAVLIFLKVSCVLQIPGYVALKGDWW